LNPVLLNSHIIQLDKTGNIKIKAVEVLYSFAQGKFNKVFVKSKYSFSGIQAFIVPENTDFLRQARYFSIPTTKP
jgi:hypothetical protein